MANGNPWDFDTPFLNSPQAQAALISFGTQMMQPVPLGQTGLGHLGTSIGQGGLGAQNATKQQLAEDEAASKVDLRGSQADAAEARAGAAASRAGAAETRATAAGLLERGRMERAQLGNRIKVSNAYQNYVKLLNKENADASLMGRPAKPVPQFGEWLSANPHLQPLIGGGPASAPGEEPEDGYGSMGVPTAPASPGAAALPPPAPAVTSGAGQGPNSAQIARLKANPSMAASFDQKFGQGASAKYLGQK